MYDGQTVIYSDILFIINFSIDLLCLFITSRLNYRAAKVYRLIISAIIGGAYAFVPYLFYYGTAVGVILHIAAAGGMVWVAFGKTELKKMLILFLTFVTSEALIGGLVNGFYGMSYRYSDGRYAEISAGSFAIICALSAFVALSYGFIARKRIHTRSVSVTLVLGNERIRADLLCDSGNLVTEPFSALPVIVLTSCCLPFPYDDPENECFPLPIRIIPFSTSSGQSCFLGFRPERIFLTSPFKKPKQIDAYVAIDRVRKSYSGYDGLFPTCIL